MPVDYELVVSIERSFDVGDANISRAESLDVDMQITIAYTNNIYRTVLLEVAL